MSIKTAVLAPIINERAYMEKDYTHYKAEQLIDDDLFLQAELHPTNETEAFWQTLAGRNKHLAEEIATARILLRSIRNQENQHPLSTSEEDELWKRIETCNHLQNKRIKRIRTIRSLAAIAATIALLVAVAWHQQQPDQQETDYIALIQATPKADDASQQVQLVLSNNRKLSLSGEETAVEYKQKGQVNVNSEQVELVSQKESEPPTLNQLIVPIGKRSTLTLADGTRVWVNSGSKVIYPVAFTAGKREIFLEGEIYLQVSRDEKRPFIVKTKQMDVRVLGTQFNLSAYENDASQRVVLVSGKVEINIPGKEKDILTPNQMLSYNHQANRTKITEVDVNDYIAWKDGYYQFVHQHLGVILKKLSRYYGNHIAWDESVSKLICSGKLDLKDSLAEVLNTLRQAAPIEIHNENESIQIKVKP